MSTTDTRLIEVYAGNILEAGMVKSLLESAGIDAFLKNEIMGTMIPWLSTPGGAGSVKLLVRDTDEAGARSIVEEYEGNLQ